MALEFQNVDVAQIAHAIPEALLGPELFQAGSCSELNDTCRAPGGFDQWGNSPANVLTINRSMCRRS